jgi:hypothetical protein
MFSYNFKENEKNEVHLPDKKYDDILQLLKYLYPNFNKEIDGWFINNIIIIF